MNDLISRSALVENATVMTKYDEGGWGVDLLAVPLCDVKTAPAVDAVEVVRCKDCKHSRELDKYEKILYLAECVGCTRLSAIYHSVLMMGDDFCSYGERRAE
jgi:hypothetical protein